jgi:hypothetical protein
METLNQNTEPTWSASKRKKFTVTLAGVFFIFIAVFFISLDMFMHTEAQAADKIPCNPPHCIDTHVSKNLAK